MSYGVNLPDLARQTATYVEKILKGAKPADLPVEQPTTLEIVLNLKTAKELGLTVSREFLLIIDDTIEKVPSLKGVRFWVKRNHAQRAVKGSS